MATPANAADITLLSACAFVANIGAAVTGFGQAIIFLFVWQIAELAGYDGSFKSAVFIQALSLFSMQPLLLYKAKVWRNAHRRVLLLFVPITLISTPLGQLVSNEVPTDIVLMVAGVLVTFVACWELYSKRKWFLRCLKKGSTDDAQGGETKAGGASNQVSGVRVDMQEDGTGAQNDPESLNEDTVIENGVANSNKLAGVETTVNPAERKTSTMMGNQLDSDVENIEEVVHGAQDDPDSLDKDTVIGVTNSTEATGEEKSASSKKEETKTTLEQLKIGFNKPTFITLLAGAASGFLGGMVAIRGPPLIFYFLHPPPPIAFDKSSQRATGVVIMFCNVAMRMVFYLVDTFSESTGHVIFASEDWRLYLSVIVCSIAGGVVGSKLFEYVKDSKDTIRGILAVLLLLCGVSLLFSAFA